ncbi:hypothetical protein EL17_21075 [Anditalea andensis]|uniref:Uncharacterized protein n=1 Tax=Anditalea andensis TaxID=1048983 RepID=A0A074KPG4_9BACT|nr:hypothetical protein EL17_21075 [Anditalea andensis]
MPLKIVTLIWTTDLDMSYDESKPLFSHGSEGSTKKVIKPVETNQNMSILVVLAYTDKVHFCLNELFLFYKST